MPYAVMSQDTEWSNVRAWALSKLSVVNNVG